MDNMQHKTIKIEFNEWCVDDDVDLPKINLRPNHKDVPSVYFSKFDADELHDGFTLEEMKEIQGAINIAVGFLELEDS
jgi:hypothetical protein|tara:strand:+ start:522 stop:755 length:234 start_codon:yes stop_codon:yes gene_type:complete